MKLLSIFAMVTTLAWGVKAISSPTRGAHWQQPASLVREFRKHPAPLPDHIAPMLKSAEAMLLGLANNHAGTPLADLVEQIRPFITQMQDSIRAAHTSAQQTLTGFGDDFVGCNTAKTTGESEAASLDTTMRGHSSAHATCRTQQRSAHDGHTACETTVASMQIAADTSCQLYQDSMREPGCGAIPPNPGETWESYVTRAATWFADERDSFMHKKEVCNNATAALDAQRLTCVGTDGSGGQQREFEDKRQECDDIQGQLESATCAYVSRVDDTCESFATCTNSLVDALEEQVADIEALETQRKVEWNATERLLCMLGVYGADGGVNATRLQTCQHHADNTSHLNLSYPSPTPRPSPCPDLLPHPCGDTYTAQEYGSLDAAAGTCTPCTFPGGRLGTDSDLDGGGWKLVWKHSYMEVGTVNDDMRFFSQHDRPCTDLAVGWCNVPNKLSFGADQQMTMAMHNGHVVYAYRGDINPELDSSWQGAILNNYVSLVDECRSNHGDPPDPEGPAGAHRYEGITFDKAAPGNYVSHCDTDRNGNGDCRWENCNPSSGSHNQMTLAIFIRNTNAGAAPAPAAPTHAPAPPPNPIVDALGCTAAAAISYPERSSVILHLDAAQSGSFELDSGATSADNNMYRWRDISGVSPQLYAVGYSAQPSVKCNSPKGQAVVQQNRQPMQIRDESGAAEIRQGVTASTVFMVLKAHDGYSWYWCFGQAGFYGVHQGWGLLQRSGQVKEYIGYADGSFPDNQKDTWNVVRPNYVSGGDYWFIVAWTIGPDKNVFYVDGEKYKEIDNGRGEIGQPARGTNKYSWTVGARYDMVEAANQEVAELVVYDKQLSETDILSLSGALRSKWID